MTTDLFREEAKQQFRPKPWQPPLLSRTPSALAMGLFAALAASALVAFATSFRFTQKEGSAWLFDAAATGWTRVSRLAAMLHEWCEVGEFLLYGRFNKVSNARLWS